MTHGSLHTLSFQMCFNSSLSRLKRIHLACRIVRRGCLMRPPVIQHLRDMADLLRSLRTTEDEIIILCPVILSAEPAHLTDQTGSHYEEMCNIIIGS